MSIKKFYTWQSTIIFKRWQSHEYSVFNTIGKQIKIGILLTVYFTSLGYLNTFAQAETDSISAKIKLDEVRVTARRAPALFSEVGRLITVIPRSEIEALPVQSLQGLLKYLMNVDVRERGPLGVQADLSLRGGSFDQVMILLNGVNITDPQTGHHSLNLPVDIRSIQRVEILEGPAARVYGPNAFSGAINIITAGENNNSIKINALAGQNGLWSGGAALNQSRGHTTSYFSAQKTASDGYVSNTDFDRHNLFAQLRYHKKNEILNFQAGYSGNAFGANAFYSGKYPNQFEKTRTFFSALSFESGTILKIKPTLYWRRNHDRFELFRDNRDALSWYQGHNYHLTDVFGGSLNASVPWQLGQTSFGGEVRSENVWSNVLGDSLDKPKPVPGEPEGTFTRSYSRGNTSLFLENNINIGQFSLSAGLMANINSSLGYSVDWFPGADLSYWLSPTLKWIVSYNQSLRIPTFTDLFYSSATLEGNRALKPEEASTLEMGFKYVIPGLKGHFHGFFRRGKNLIDWGRNTDSEEKYKTSNINRIDAMGIETSVDIETAYLWPELPLLKSLSVNYGFLNQDKSPRQGYESVYVLNHLKHKLNIKMRHAIIKNVDAVWMFLYRDREGFFVRTSENKLINYQSNWLTDLKVTWKRGNWRVYGEASNLFDHNYYDMGELPMPGRWLRFGIEVSFSRVTPWRDPTK